MSTVFLAVSIFSDEFEVIDVPEFVLGPAVDDLARPIILEDPETATVIYDTVHIDAHR